MLARFCRPRPGLTRSGRGRVTPAARSALPALLIAAGVLHASTVRPAGLGPGGAWARGLSWAWGWGSAAAGVAAAPLPERVWTDEPLTEALARARSSGRVLLVVMSNDEPKARRAEAVWANPALRAWVERYGVAVHVRERDVIRRLVAGKLRASGPETPLVFVDGRSTPLAGAGGDAGGPGGGGGGGDAEATRLRASPVPAGKRDAGSGVRLLYQLEWTRQAQASRRPAWWAEHVRACPPLPARAVPRLAGERAEGVEAVAAPGGALAREAAWFDLLGEVDALLSSGEPAALARATGLATLLWERALLGEEAARAGAGDGPGDGPDAVLEPLALFALAPRMEALAQAHEPARARFGRMRDAYAIDLPQRDDGALFAYLTLARVTGEQLEPLDLLDSALNVPGVRRSMPPGFSAVLERLLPRCTFADPLGLSGSGPAGARAFVKRLMDRALAEPPARPDAPAGPGAGGGGGGGGGGAGNGGGEAGDAARAERAARQTRERAEAFARETAFVQFLVRLEGPRLYAALLGAGRAEDAAALAGDLAARPEAGGAGQTRAEAYRRLVLAALSEGLPRGEHATWLRDDASPDGRALLKTVESILATLPPAGPGDAAPGR